MPLSTSDYVTIGAAIAGAVIAVVGAVWVSNNQRSKNAIYEVKNKFKSLLTEDLPAFKSEETTFSACILQLYPKHKSELEQLLIYLPESQKEKIIKAWQPYEQLYNEKEAFGVFGAIITEQPHPDFEPSIENIQSIERKRKKQVVNVFNEIQKML